MGVGSHPSRRWCCELTSLCVLGSTGSIGVQSLDVARDLPGTSVVGLAARSNWREILRQAKDFRPLAIALEDPSAAEAARRERASAGLPDLEILEGQEGTLKIASMSGADTVIHAIPGFRGVRPLLSSLEAGKRIAFAGKEALVSAGELIAPYLRAPGSMRGLVPIDSEHSAVFQSLLAEDPASVAEIVLTASGGALRDFTAEGIAKVTSAEVLAHPTWRMGKKVTVDSATLFNKALEVVEAHYLFGLPYSKIKVVVHRESIVHSMVTFVDGSTKAQAARPDMRIPIAYGITYPERRPTAVASLNPYVGKLTFEEPDLSRFPCLELGFRAGEMGGTAPCALSAADEILVEEFLSGRIGFLDIQRVLGAVLDRCEPKEVTGLHVLEAEKAWAERTVRELLS